MQYPDLKRLDGWEKRLVTLAGEWRTRPYSYGESDCGCFARVAIEALTGVTMLPGVEFPKGWLALAKFMIARGWSSVEDSMVELLGPPVEATASRRGDIVSYEEGGELHLAVRIGDVALTPSLSGLRVIEENQWLRAWKVG